MTMMNLKRVELEGKRYVIVEEDAFERLRSQAVGEGQRMPALPQPDADGRVPAVEFGRVSIARSIIDERRGLGLTQTALAQAAGIRQETLSRLESGKHTPSAPTLERIEIALAQAAKA